MTDMCKSDPSCTLCLAAVSHIFCFVQCQNFHSPSFSSIWLTGEELIFIPSIRKKTLTLYIPILFYTLTFICVAATFSLQFNWCFCCRNSNWKRGFYSSALLCCKKKIENAGFPVPCVILLQKTCPQVEMRSTLRFSPLGIHNYPSWRCKNPIFTTTRIFTFHNKM